MNPDYLKWAGGAIAVLISFGTIWKLFVAPKINEGFISKTQCNDNRVVLSKNISDTKVELADGIKSSQDSCNKTVESYRSELAKTFDAQCLIIQEFKTDVSEKLTTHREAITLLGDSLKTLNNKAIESGVHLEYIRSQLENKKDKR